MSCNHKHRETKAEWNNDKGMYDIMQTCLDCGSTREMDSTYQAIMHTETLEVAWEAKKMVNE